MADDYPGISINPNYAGQYPTASEAREQLEYLTSTLNWTDSQVVAQSKKSVAQDSSQDTYTIYRAYHSFDNVLYGSIRHDSDLEVDSVYNTFLNATHDISPHWRNIPGTDLDWVENDRWDYSIDKGDGWLFGVRGTLWVYWGPWIDTKDINATCTITTNDI